MIPLNLKINGGNFGKSCEHINILEAGIITPTKITRIALGCVVTEAKSAEPAVECQE